MNANAFFFFFFPSSPSSISVEILIIFSPIMSRCIALPVCTHCYDSEKAIRVYIANFIFKGVLWRIKK